MTYPFFLGVDLGQSKDFTAIAVVTEWLWSDGTESYQQLNLPAAGWIDPATVTPHQAAALRSLNFHNGRPPDPPLVVGHLERLPLHTSYPSVIERVAALLKTPPLRPETTALIVDATGVGAPVVDAMRLAGLSPIATTITAGNTVARDADTGAMRVPKRDLVSTVSVLLEQRRLKIAASLPEATTLRGELEAFRRKVSPAGDDSFSSWRESDHDDLVLAVALAVWYRAWLNEHIDRANADAGRRQLALSR